MIDINKIKTALNLHPWDAYKYHPLLQALVDAINVELESYQPKPEPGSRFVTEYDHEDD